MSLLLLFFGGASAVAEVPVVETPRRRGGGGDDGYRRAKTPKRKAYVEWTRQREEDDRRRERELFDDILGREANPAVAEVDRVAEIAPAPPPLPVAEAKALPPKVEHERIMALMSAGLDTLGENFTRLNAERLRREAKRNKVVPPEQGPDHEAETRALVAWLEARAKWIERQQEEERAEALRIEREADEQDEENVILMLLAA
jgi:hypothetical protein